MVVDRDCAILVVGAGVTVWLLRRRSAARVAAQGPEAAWASLRDHLPDELRWPLSLTPLEAAERLDSEVRATDMPFTDTAARALIELRDVVSDARYAPPEYARDVPSQEWLVLQVQRVAEEANAAVRSRPDRVGARSAPRHDS